MKKIFASFLFLSFISMNVAMADNTISIGNVVKTTTSAPSTPVVVKNPVSVSFDVGGTSKTFKTDDVLPVTIAKTTTINGIKFVAGDKGYLNLGKVESSQNLGKGGVIVISNGRIKDANGREHICKYTQTFIGEENNTVKVLTGVGVFCWPLLLSCLKNGKEATLSKEYIVQVSIVE